MNDDLLWENFIRTGSLEDYMAYVNYVNGDSLGQGEDSDADYDKWNSYS